MYKDFDNVFEAAYAVLVEAEPDKKCVLAQGLSDAWQAGTLSLQTKSFIPVVHEAGRPKKPVLVCPRDLPKRSLHTPEGRVIFMHAIAHIEFNAINLACDAVYRFRDMPSQYYADWIQVAADEARHFILIVNYMCEQQTDYGDYPAHNGLWDIAVKTAGDVLARMALVPRVLEARGLDVTPAMIEKLYSVDDQSAASILELIYREEIAHVEAGSRWFKYICKQRQLNPQVTFFQLVDQFFSGPLRGPFNFDAREQAGFDAEELKKLAEF